MYGVRVRRTAEQRSASAKKAAATRAAKTAIEDEIAATMTPPKAGDIFYSSWGYDQTNIDFYKVVSVSTSGRTAKVVKIGKHVEYRGSGSDSVTPNPEFEVGEPMTKHLRVTTWRGSDREWFFSLTSYSDAWQWDGRALHETASGWGH